MRVFSDAAVCRDRDDCEHDRPRCIRQSPRSDRGDRGPHSRAIAEAGTAVDLRQVDAVESLDAYDAVVFGAPVYDQSWPPEADRFVNHHRDVLAARPVWLFSVGSFGDTKRLIGPLTHKEPKRIAEVRSAVQPREYRVFQGVIRKHQWPFWSRILFHAFGGRFGDHRDWPVIEAWADQIALALVGG